MIEQKKKITSMGTEAGLAKKMKRGCAYLPE
jgi:hypothetical protein